MQTRPTQLSQNEIQNQNAPSTQNSEFQHGLLQQDSSLLLDIPAEILNRITSNLDPHGLFALSLARKYLFEHVDNDNTWRHAFLAQYLGVGPEGDIQDSTKHVMLRRTHPTWKLEFIARNELIRRWARSPVGTVSHSPLHSQISDMVLVENDALLCSSTFYGVVARSFPLTGKVLSGFLDATGSTNGRHIGNPNAQFTPNVATCVIAADGGTVRILWGYRNGLVSFMTTVKTLDSARRALSAFRTCGLADQHDRQTTDALWLGPASGWMAVTASDDGRAKVWDSDTGRCLWASEATLRVMVPEPVAKVTASYALGCIVAIQRSGEIRVWSGFDFKETTAPLAYTSSSSLPCPYVPANPEEIPEVLSLEIDNTLPSPVLLVAYRHDRLFYRLDLSKDLTSHRVVSFGEEALSAPSAICPCFSDDPSMSSVVITGDTLGCANVYLWDSDDDHVTPFHSFEAYRDGSTITSVAWNGATLVTGSSRGVTQIFDGISFERLKKIASPVPALSHRRGADVATEHDRENVHHIILGPGKDTLFVGVGDRVLAWKPGPVSRTLKGGVRARKSAGAPIKRVQSGNAKFSGQHQIRKFISESKGMMVEEDKRIRHVQGRFNQQRAQLRDLGLSEAETVEYILMMTREHAEAEAKADAEARAAASAASSSSSHLSPSSSVPKGGVSAADALSEEELERALAEGMFEDDFAVIQQSIGHTATPRQSSPPTRTPPSGASPNQSRTALRLAASPSNSKVQVLPVYVPEPMEAGPTIDGIVTPSPCPRRHCQPDLEDDDEFPVVSSGTPSPAGSDAASSAGSAASGLSSRRNSTSSSLSDFGGLKRMSPPKGAWSAPLRTSAVASTSGATRGASGSATSPGRAPGSASVVGRGVGVQRSPVASTTRVAVPTEMDEDMRFAIELSLAEARSRGENV